MPEAAPVCGCGGGGGGRGGVHGAARGKQASQPAAAAAGKHQPKATHEVNSITCTGSRVLHPAADHLAEVPQPASDRVGRGAAQLQLVVGPACSGGERQVRRVRWCAKTRSPHTFERWGRCRALPIAAAATRPQCGLQGCQWHCHNLRQAWGQQGAAAGQQAELTHGKATRWAIPWCRAALHAPAESTRPARETSLPQHHLRRCVQS